jgi:MFS family permease
MDWFHYTTRSTYMLVSGCFTLAGYAVLIGSNTVGVKYFACFLCTTGIYILTGLNITWIGSNTKGRYKRAVAIGMNQTLGNAGGVLSGQIYLATQAPRYIEGQAVSLSMFGVGMIVTIIMLLVLLARNAQKAKRLASGANDVPNGKFLGDDSIHFTYML